MDRLLLSGVCQVKCVSFFDSLINCHNILMCDIKTSLFVQSLRMRRKIPPL